MPLSRVDYSKLVTPCQRLASFELLVPLSGGKRVLDIGCATGDYLSTFGEGSVGVDLSRESLEICRKKGLTVAEADFNKTIPFPDEGFDVVFCSHVLEHVDSPVGLLREMNRLLEPGGTLIIGLPSEATVIRLIRDRYFRDHAGHLYSFSPSGIRRILEYTGFHVDKFIIDFWLVKRLRLQALMRLGQRLPLWLTFPVSNAYWAVATKVG